MMLNALVPEIRRTAELVRDVSAAPREQAGVADRIDSAIRQLDPVVQRNAGTAEEPFSTAAERTARAEQLHSAVAFFPVDSAHRASGRDAGRTRPPLPCRSED